MSDVVDISLARIEALISAVGLYQMAVEPIVDTDLGFRMWGGKDGSGVSTKFLAKDRAARVLSATITELSGTGGWIKVDGNGKLILHASILASDIPDHNDLNGKQGGSSGQYYHLTSAQASEIHSPMTIAGDPLTLVGQVLTFNYESTDFNIAAHKLGISSKYMLTDGSRDFTGAVKVPTPTLGLHAANKDYVDAAITGFDWLKNVKAVYDNSTGLPAVPVNGDRWIAGATANGWTKDHIYTRVASSWVNFTPEMGQSVILDETDPLEMRLFTGIEWRVYGATITAPVNELMFGTGSGYSSSDTLKYTDGALWITHASGVYAIKKKPTVYAPGLYGAIQSVMVEPDFTSAPLPSSFYTLAGWLINGTSTAYLVDMATNSEGGPRAAMYPFARSRQGIVAGVSSDSDLMTSHYAVSSSAQITLVYDGAVGSVFRSDNGTTDMFARVGCAPTNVGSYGAPIWADSMHFELDDQSRPLDIAEGYYTRIMGKGLDVVDSLSGVYPASQRTMSLRKELMINGIAPYHRNHGVKKNSDGTDITNGGFTAALNSRTVTLGSGHRSWVLGVEFDTHGMSYTFDDVTGMHYVKVSESAGSAVINNGGTVWNLLTEVPITACYWNATLGEGIYWYEQHSWKRDPLLHSSLHFGFGTQQKAGGFVAGNYAYNTNTLAAVQHSISSGTLLDEDIQYVLPALAPGSYTQIYRTGSGSEVTWSRGQSVPYPLLNTHLAFNSSTGGTWGFSEVGNNNFVTLYIVGATAIHPEFNYLHVLGQTEYTTLEAAQAETYSTLQLGDLANFTEFLPLYKCIYKHINSYTNPGHTALISMERMFGSRASQSIGAITMHGSLQGRELANQHPLAAIYAGAANLIPFSDGTGLTVDTSFTYDTVNNRLGVDQIYLGGVNITSVFAPIVHEHTTLGTGGSVWFTAFGDHVEVWSGRLQLGPTGGSYCQLQWGSVANQLNMASVTSIKLNGTYTVWSDANLTDAALMTIHGSKTANTVLAAPDGSAGTPSFRLMVAADIPNLAASKITSGALAVARGGTNKSSWTQFSLPYASTTTALSEVAPSTTAVKKYLRMLGNGSVGAAPDWDTPVFTKTITIEAPVTGENITIFRTDSTIYIDEVLAVSTGTSPSTTYQLKYGSSRNSGVSLSNSMTTTSVAGGDAATFSTRQVAAGNWIWLVTTGASGTGVTLTVNIRYSEV